MRWYLKSLLSAVYIPKCIGVWNQTVVLSYLGIVTFYLHFRNWHMVTELVWFFQIFTLGLRNIFYTGPISYPILFLEILYWDSVSFYKMSPSQTEHDFPVLWCFEFSPFICFCSFLWITGAQSASDLAALQPLHSGLNSLSFPWMAVS